jgi:REP element-mobilizing transposase RayT
MLRKIRPITIASHIIWTNYGIWLPNDPRGSTSTHVFNQELLELGELHYGRKRVQPKPKVVKEFYRAAEQFLKFPVIRFDANQIAHIAEYIGNFIQQRGYTCYACAVMPDHVHIFIRKHRDDAWDMLDELQQFTRKGFIQNYPETDSDHPLWTNGGYVNFVATSEIVRRVIKYIAENPLKIGLPAQSWPFVKAYDNWPHHHDVHEKGMT